MRRFETELDELRKSLLEMSELVEAALYRSVMALVRKDEAMAQEVFRNEGRINRMQIEIDEKATRLLALEQPVARDLRFLTSAIKINSDLERMGDEAVNIMQRAQLLMHQPSLDASVDIAQLAGLAESMVRDALEAFVKREPELARSVLAADDRVDRSQDAIHQQLLSLMEQDPKIIPQCVSLMFVAHSLERIADHATNIAEDVLFLVRGVDVRHHAEAGM